MERFWLPSPHGEMKVSVFGFEFAGTVTSACLADNSHDVEGIDIDDRPCPELDTLETYAGLVS